MKSKIAVITVTAYLVIVYLFANTEVSPLLLALLCLLVPVFLVTMIIVILKDDSRAYPELGNEEWGYKDKEKSSLGLF